MSESSPITLITNPGRLVREGGTPLPEGFAALAADRSVVETLAVLLRAWEADAQRFEEIVERMMPPELVSAAGAEQAQQNAELRTRALEELQMLDSDQVAALVGSRARNRAAAASRLVRSGRIIGLTHGGRRLFPAFQFDPESGQARDEVSRVVRTLADRGVTGWAALLWMTRPSGWLGGARPVDVLDESPERVLAAAEDVGVAGG